MQWLVCFWFPLGLGSEKLILWQNMAQKRGLHGAADAWDVGWDTVGAMWEWSTRSPADPMSKLATCLLALIHATLTWDGSSPLPPSPGESPGPAQSAEWRCSISMVMVGSMTTKDSRCTAGIITQDSGMERRAAAAAAAVPTSARTHNHGPSICH